MNSQDKAWWLKTGSILVILFSWIIYFWWKSKNADQNSNLFFTILGIVTFLGIIILFKDKISSLFPNNKDEIIPAMSEKEILKKIEEIAYSKWNNLKRENLYEWQRTKTINKNQIYARKVNLDLDNEQFIIVLNATYPNSSSPSVYAPYKIENGNKIPLDKDDYYIDKYMNEKSISPDSEPDRIITEMGQDQFGRPIGKEERIIHKKEEKEEEVQ